VFYYRGITLLSYPGKFTPGVLERKLRPPVEPQTQEGQCGFPPGRGTVDQIFTFAELLRGSEASEEKLCHKKYVLLLL